MTDVNETAHGSDFRSTECERLAKLYVAAPEVVEAAKRLLNAFDMFSNEANWGASSFSAETIREVNEAPGKLRAALAKAGAQS